MELVVRATKALPPGLQPVEVVERKGLGHPDTICDALAEEISVKLCRYYMERFGVILHHNVDKILLCGGSARPVFGGGEILEPMELYLSGRATRNHNGELIPVDDIAADACLEWFKTHLPMIDTERHVETKTVVRQIARDTARGSTNLEVDAVVNAADDISKGDIYLTVTGTSAEAGDDGEVGRGNRTSGLITPYRPMTIEAAAGKNPVSHVGKLYNIAAGAIAARIASHVAGIQEAICILVSEIGRPIEDPQIVDVRVVLEQGQRIGAVTKPIREAVKLELSRFPELQLALLEKRVQLY